MCPCTCRYEEKLRLARSLGAKKGLIVGTSLFMIYFVLFACYAAAFWYEDVCVSVCARTCVTACMCVVSVCTCEPHVICMPHTCTSTCRFGGFLVRERILQVGDMLAVSFLVPPPPCASYLMFDVLLFAVWLAFFSVPCTWDLAPVHGSPAHCVCMFVCV